MYMYIYHKYLDALNTFRHAMPFKQIKNNIQRTLLESVLLSSAKWDTFLPSKGFISLLSFQFCITFSTCSQKCTSNF